MGTNLTAETHSSTPLWVRRLAHGVVDAYNAVVVALQPPWTPGPAVPELFEIAERARSLSDISDHLVPLYYETLELAPKLIVELGVRGGESTFVFERVARRTGAALVSVDLEDCSKVLDYPRWNFVRADDIEFSQRFPDWCREKQLPAEIDALFIDTSHVYEHTLQEMKSWLPWVGARGKVFFHDTNQRRFYWRRNGTAGLGWWNERGVIRAIEDYFGRRFDERRDFVDAAGGWMIRHTSTCSGLTILSRIPGADGSGR
ncbi:MAG: class I SAM-dependent methyltransferase [Verrucomicrobia bacterium]|nr:class I SAM-dependent methyltransferase [Verrucomicrobiota bacterium]